MLKLTNAKIQGQAIYLMNRLKLCRRLDDNHLGARAGCLQYSAAPLQQFSFAMGITAALYGVLAPIPGAGLLHVFFTFFPV